MKQRSFFSRIVLPTIAIILLALARLIFPSWFNGPTSTASANPTKAPTTIVKTVSAAKTATPKITKAATTAATKVFGSATVASTNTDIAIGSTDPLLQSIQVYFTDPASSNEQDLSVDKYVTKYVLPLVTSAQKTIDVTSFDLNLPVFINALVDASKRGVQVRVVHDGTNGKIALAATDDPTGLAIDTLAVLSAANIPVVDGGRSNGLMHNKMIIVDGKTLVMGSWNMSYNDTYRNNNNVLIITNPVLIANYQAKFNEMFVDKRFGAKSVNKVLTPQVMIGGSLVENYFSPRDEVMEKLVALVKTAKKSVRFLAFTYTDLDLVNAMIERKQAGLTVEGTVETRSASYLIVPNLFCAKIGVKNDGNQYTFHHKILIIDDSIVVTGSFNFTETADSSNDDNVLIIHNKAIADKYVAEFNKQYGASRTVNSSEFNCENVAQTAMAAQATSIQATAVRVNQTAAKSVIQTGTAGARATATVVKATKSAQTATAKAKP